MEKKESRAFRVNVVDILITVVIAGVITFGAFMIASAFGVDTAEKTDYTVLYTLQFRGMEPEYADKIARSSRRQNASTSARSPQFRPSRMSRMCMTRRPEKWSPPRTRTTSR